MERIKEIADHFGLKNQTIKTIEECLELVKALCLNDKENTIEEIADVTIMIKQLTYLLDIEKEVDDMIKFKIDRTMRRYNI